MAGINIQKVQTIYESIHQLIVDAKHSIQQTVNQALTVTYWHIGKELTTRLVNNETKEKTGELVYSVSRLLVAQHGKGFSRANLFHFMRFYSVYPDENNVYSLSRQISWTHFRSLIYIENQAERDFYTELSQHENWSTRVLRDRIGPVPGYMYQVAANCPNHTQQCLQTHLSIKQPTKVGFSGFCPFSRENPQNPKELEKQAN